MTETIQTWDPGTSRIGNLFSKQLWNHYDGYYQGFAAMRYLLREKKRSDQEFAQFCRIRHGASHHSLESLLLLPVQRVHDYDVFLSRLLEETDPSHPDYDDLNKAASRVQMMVKEREEELKHVQNDQKVESVQDRFPNDDLQLQDKEKKAIKPAARRRSGPGAVILKPFSKKHHPGEKSPPPVPDTVDSPMLLPPHGNCSHSNRVYVLEGPVQFTTACQTQDRYLFLFNDVMLIAKQKSTNIFKLKHRVRVCELWLSECIDQVAETQRPPERSFVLGWPTTNFVATFSSQSLAEVWKEKLVSQIQAEKEKEESMCVIKIRFNDSSSNCQSMMKSLAVSNDESAGSVVYRCIDEFRLVGKDAKDYQLWSRSPNKDEPLYPLFGHEHPYSIRKNHERDWNQDRDPRLDSLRGLDLSYFTLQTAKKKPRDLSLDDTKRAKKVKRSPLNLFKKSPKPTVLTPSGKLFGHPLASLTDNDGIPEPIMVVLRILFEQGPFTVGVFRKPGSQKKLQNVKSKMDANEPFDVEELNVPVAASLLKDFLMKLPDCLLGSEKFDLWVTTTQLPDTVQQVNLTKRHVENLPKSHQNLLRHLMCVLHTITCTQANQEQGMDSYAMAVCIGQSLLWPGFSSSCSQHEAVAKVPGVVQFLIDNCIAVFGEDCTKLFGELPAQTKPRQDSSTDSDSLHSLLSLPEQQCVGNRDTSSLDSLERDCYDPEMDSSPQLAKSQLSPTNLSRDSGLTLSDNQLFEDGTESEHSSIAPRKPSGMSRSYSQFEDPGPSADPGTLSTSHDGMLNMAHGGAPVPPPRRAKRRSAGPELESININKPTNSLGVPQMKTSSSSQDFVDHRKQVRQMYANKRLSDDSTLGSLDEEYPPEMFAGIDMQQYRRSQDMGVLRKSESGAHLYLSEDSRSSSQRTVVKDKKRSVPSQVFNIQVTDDGKGVPRLARRTDIHKLGGSLDITIGTSNVPILENQVLSLSSTYPSGAFSSKSQATFSLTPPDSPDPDLDNSGPGLLDNYPEAMDTGVKLVSHAIAVAHGYNTQKDNSSVQTRSGKDKLTKALSVDLTDVQSKGASKSSKVQMRAKSMSLAHNSIDNRRAKLSRGDAIDSTVLPKAQTAPTNDKSQKGEAYSGDNKLRKGMTASGADRFPKTIPLRTSLYSLDEEALIKAEALHKNELLPSHNATGNSQSISSFKRSDSYNGVTPTAADHIRQRLVEKSASDTSVSEQFALASPVKATATGSAASRPVKPPSYEEAIQRKLASTVVDIDLSPSPEDIVTQQQNSAKAKKLYEESLKKFNGPELERPGRSGAYQQHQQFLEANKNKSSIKEPPPYEQACQRAAQIREHRETINASRKAPPPYAKREPTPPRTPMENRARNSPDAQDQRTFNQQSPLTLMAHRGDSDRRDHRSRNPAQASHSGQSSDSPRESRPVDIPRSPRPNSQSPHSQSSDRDSPLGSRHTSQSPHSNSPRYSSDSRHVHSPEHSAKHASRHSESPDHNRHLSQSPRRVETLRTEQTQSRPLSESPRRERWQGDSIMLQGKPSSSHQSPVHTQSSSIASSIDSQEGTPGSLDRQQSPQHHHTETASVTSSRESTPTRSNRESTPTHSKRESTPTRSMSTYSNRESAPTHSDQEIRPTETSVSNSAVERSRQQQKRERRRSGSRSRERRSGQRYSDPKISTVKATMNNLGRSKSDSQEHLDKVGKFKQLRAYENNKENISLEDLRKGRRSNRSTPERKPSDERIKSQSPIPHLSDKVIKAAVAELQKDPEMGGRVRRLSIPSVKHRDWHKDLASQYKDTDIFYRPESESTQNIVQFGYVSSNKNSGQNSGDNSKKRWVPPVHPTKDLIYTTREENRHNSRLSAGVSRSGSGLSQSSVSRSGSSASKSSASSNQSVRRVGHETSRSQERPTSLWTDDIDKLEEQYHRSKSETRLKKNSTKEAESHKSGNNYQNSEAGCINWSVTELRNNFTSKNDGATENKQSTGTHFYSPGSQPPAPVSRHKTSHHNAPWRSNKTHYNRTPSERTNPSADEAYI